MQDYEASQSGQKQECQEENQLMLYQASIPHEAATIEEFRANPVEARAYLAAVIADGDPGEIQLAKRRVEAALGDEWTEKSKNNFPS